MFSFEEKLAWRFRYLSATVARASTRLLKAELLSSAPPTVSTALSGGVLVAREREVRRIAKLK